MTTDIAWECLSHRDGVHVKGWERMSPKIH